MDLEGPRPWIWKDFDGFGGSQTLDLEGFLWIWRVPGLGFGRISMDLEGPRPWIWHDFDGFGVSQALDLEMKWHVPYILIASFINPIYIEGFSLQYLKDHPPTWPNGPNGPSFVSSSCHTSDIDGHETIRLFRRRPGLIR